MKKINNILKSKKGFTLIELVVVIAVLGMIAVVAVPKIAGITDKAKTASDAQTIAILNEAVERYVAESGDDDLSQITTDSAKDVLEDLKGSIEDENDASVKYGPFIKAGSYELDNDSVKLPSGKTATFDAKEKVFEAASK